jgi:hypothetical protein
VKLYDKNLWITDTQDNVCHGYYGTLENYRILKQMLMYNYRFLKIIKRQSIGLCIHACNRNHYAFEFILHKSDRLINNILKKSPICIKYLQDLKYEVYLDAVKIDSKCIEYVPEQYQTEELCMIAVDKSPANLRFIINQSENICLKAIGNKYWYSDYIQYINNPTEDIWIELFKKDRDSILIHLKI